MKKEKGGKESSQFQIWHGVLIVLVAILFRWATACGPYSGQNKPPMFGDYEAQRHWMEITYALPITEWYFNTTRNDLLYWGLDYPPLTAYHSYLLGAASTKLNKTWVALDESRGHESYQHKLFMRYSVLVVDILVFLPAVFIYVLKIQKAKADAKTKIYFLITWLMYPGMILIDYGHFQYNCVSLGFFIWAASFILLKYDIIGSVFFVLALSYKQMELYHALPFFCYLLGGCIRERPVWHGFRTLYRLAATVIVTFGAVWFPFVIDLRQATQVFHRLFPFARGIFEDKVANVWCALSIVIKWRKYFEIQQLVYLCGGTTLATLAPMTIFGTWTPTKQNFKLSLIISSLCFFLFSFQVHEKTILLVAIPMLLVLHEEPFVVTWFLLVSVISLLPLCVKDHTQLAFFAWLFFYYVWTCDFLRSTESVVGKKSAEKSVWSYVQTYAFHASILVGTSICIAALLITPPSRYPDLFALFNSIYCCAHFCCFLVYFYLKMFRETFASSSSISVSKKRKVQ